MAAVFSDRLLRWWETHGRHDLPWQHPRTPYRAWVSEIMLQQTQVTTVIPYFERFVARFPDLPSLAAADLDEVLALWSGLGYYARARNLHKTALACAERHGGRLPATATELAALPGIGQSTANAILSQARDVPATVLDGNVRRVIARHDAIGGWVGKPAVQRKLWQAAQSRLPQSRGADYTQAIMDLGATICTRTKPTCTACPVSDDCKAFRAGTVDRLPSPRPKVQVKEKDLHMLMVTSPDGQVLLERRPPAGIWGGLWSLPDGQGPTEIADRIGLVNGQATPLPAFEHRLTHLRIRVTPWLARAEQRAHRVECNQDTRWFGRAEWPGLGLPQPVQRLLNQHFEESRR
jgi:A/G-specific adenine glycosylase